MNKDRTLPPPDPELVGTEYGPTKDKDAEIIREIEASCMEVEMAIARLRLAVQQVENRVASINKKLTDIENLRRLRLPGNGS